MRRGRPVTCRPPASPGEGDESPEPSLARPDGFGHDCLPRSGQDRILFPSRRRTIARAAEIESLAGVVEAIRNGLRNCAPAQAPRGTVQREPPGKLRG